MRFVDPKSNIAFKKIFGNETKKEILISFLNAVLMLKDDKEIQEITILDSYQAPKLSHLKETILDVRAKDKRGINFIVEMQVEKEAYFHKRALYYASKAYISQIDKGVDYPKLNQVFFIGILNFDLFESPKYLSKHLILDNETYKQELKDLEFDFIELNKFNKELPDLETIIDKWIYFFKYTEDLKVIPKELESVKEIKEAFEIAEQHNWTKEELDIYDYWQVEHAKNLSVIETAKRDAKLEGKLEVAKNLLALDMDIKTISKVTGLSKDVIKTLKN
jgi:predicted transposase/invertase (TIGR01784 family)